MIYRTRKRNFFYVECFLAFLSLLTAAFMILWTSQLDNNSRAKSEPVFWPVTDCGFIY